MPAIRADGEVAHRDRQRQRSIAPCSERAQACVCACGRRIRIAPAVLALGPVICALCSEPFEPVEPGG
jgi:hypothetical protein